MDEQELRIALRNLVLPPTGPMLLMLGGWLLARASRALRGLGRTLVVLGFASLWILSTPVISGQLVRWSQAYAPLDLGRRIDAQAVVILGGGTRRNAPEYGGPAPAQLTLQRMAYGVRVARATHLPVLVTGGGGEGPAMAAVLAQDFRLPPRWVETAAANTQQNAALSAPLLRASGVTRIVLVTSDLHMRRAVSEFESQGLQVIAAPVEVPGPPEPRWTDFIPGIAALRDSHYVLYELLGDLVRRLRAAS